MRKIDGERSPRVGIAEAGGHKSLYFSSDTIEDG